MFFHWTCRSVVSADLKSAGGSRRNRLCSDLLCRRGVSDDVGRRKDTVERANPKLRHEQAASEPGGPGTPSHGQRQSQAVDEAGMHRRVG